MKDLGRISDYLDISIDYEYKNGETTLDQKNYFETLAKKYVFKNSKLCAVPMIRNLKSEEAQQVCYNIKFRNFIGAFWYVSAGTRPDISFNVN